MAKAYTLHEKCGYCTGEDGFESLSAALARMKEMIRESCVIDRELAAIGAKGLPAPKYRASVCRYLKHFFTESGFPSPSMIDYSDYEGEPREFDPDSFHEFDEYDDIDEYEFELGFIFTAGKQGMRLVFLERLSTIVYFKKYAESAFFGIETFSRDRMNLDVRIFKSEKNLPPKLTGSFYPVVLLSILLNGTKCTIENAAHAMSETLYRRMNESYALPSKLTFATDTVCDYIDIIKKIGYDVRGENREYYIPPLICKQDAELVLRCVEESKLSKTEKAGLAEKFILDSGYHRYAKNESEESAAPIPKHGDWETGDYAMIIFHMLRFLSRPVQVSSTQKENLRALIQQYYGIEEMPKRQTVSDNIMAMIGIGLPIQRGKGGYCYDMTGRLLAADIEILLGCISAADGLDALTKERLCAKLKVKFPTEKYFK